MTAARSGRRSGPAPQARVEADLQAPLVLAVDSSGPVEGIALVQGGLVLGSWSGRRPGRRGSGLVGRIQQVADWSGRQLSQLDAVAGVVGVESRMGSNLDLVLQMPVGMVVAGGTADSHHEGDGAIESIRQPPSGLQAMTGLEFGFQVRFGGRDVDRPSGLDAYEEAPDE